MSINNYWISVFTWWPATLAMILGSFVAGSTPLGGGVVAFPISVLVLQFTGGESRDVAVLIQSIGMNAAAYVFYTQKRHLLNQTFIFVFILFGFVGLLLGMTFDVSDKLINLVYTILVFEFSIFYAYRNIIMNQIQIQTVDIEKTIEKKDDKKDDLQVSVKKIEIETSVSDINNFLLWSGMIACAIIGGFATSNVGTGSDIALYIFGLLCWNGIVKPSRKLTESQLTASSIVVMGGMSVLTVIMRIILSMSSISSSSTARNTTSTTSTTNSTTINTSDYMINTTNTTSNAVFTSRVLETWMAMIPVVVVGAPLGSLVLTPERLPWLRRMFYVLAVFQLIMFGVLKIKNNWVSWLVIGIITILQVAFLCLHRRCST